MPDDDDIIKAIRKEIRRCIDEEDLELDQFPDLKEIFEKVSEKDNTERKLDLNIREVFESLLEASQN